MHRLLDAGMPDGRFETLTHLNAVVFQVIFIGVGLFLMVIALVLVFRPGWFASLTVAVRGFRAEAHLLWVAFSLPKDSYLDLIFLLAIGLVGIVVRLARIMAPMGYDESYTANEYARSLWTALTDYSLPNNHVLHTVLVYFSTRIFGFEPWAVRLPAVLIGILIPAALYWLCSVFYDRKTGLLAALLAAVAYPLILFSTDSRGYMLIAFFTIVALWLAAFLVRNRNLLGWLLLSFSIALGFSTVPVMMFPFGIIFLWLLAEGIMEGGQSYGGVGQFAVCWLSSGILVALGTLLLYLPVLIYSGPDALFHNQFVRPLPWNDFLDILPRRLMSIWSEWVHGLPVALIALLLLGLVLSLALHSRVSRFRVPLQVVAVLWLGALAFIRRPDPWERLFVFLVPLLLMWVSAGLMGALGLLQDKLGSNYPWARVGIAIPVALSLIYVGTMLPSLPRDWASETGPPETLVRWLQKELRANDLIVVAYPNDAPVRYYARLYGINNSDFDTSQPFERLFVIVRLSTKQTPSAVLSQSGLDQSVCDSSPEPFTSFGYLDVFVCSPP